MSYQSTQCFYKFCDKCNVEGCACFCHKVSTHSEVIQFIQKKKSKSNLVKRKDKLIGRDSNVKI